MIVVVYLFSTLLDFENEKDSDGFGYLTFLVPDQNPRNGTQSRSEPGKSYPNPTLTRLLIPEPITRKGCGSLPCSSYNLGDEPKIRFLALIKSNHIRFSKYKHHIIKIAPFLDYYSSSKNELFWKMMVSMKSNIFCYVILIYRAQTFTSLKGWRQISIKT